MNIIESIKHLFTSDVINDVATHTNESPSAISTALNAAIPTILSGLLLKKQNNSNFNLIDLVKNVFENKVDFNVHNVLNDLHSGGTVTNNLSNIFGSNVSDIASKIAGFANIKEESAHKVLGLASTGTLGTLKEESKRQNWDINGMFTFLKDQWTNIKAALPSGFNLSSIAGLAGLSSLAFGANTNNTPNPVSTQTNPIPQPQKTYTPPPNNQPEYEKKSGNKWITPLILILLLLGIIWWLSNKGCNKEKEVTPITTTTTAPDTMISTETVTTTTVKREPLKLTLPSGVVIDAYKNGIEDQMVTYLKSGDYKTADEAKLKDVWYNFDDLNFEFGTAKITPESETQVKNIIAILKEFPDAKIKIGAYTDKKGDDNSNLKLSKERAESVLNKLKDAGVAKQVVGAEGYGEQFAKVDENATDKERESDRKTAVRFAK